MKGKSVKRFNEIVKVFASYGFGYWVDSKSKDGNRVKSPQNLRKAFEDLGVSFIKIGQILSTRSDLLPKEYIRELEKLQDSSSTTNFIEIEKIFYDEFGESIRASFEYFEKQPLASASIAQVHRAILKNGKNVVVKVQHPEIKEKMELDFYILKKILKVTKANERFKDSFIDPLDALREIKYYTDMELDFEEEALNMIQFKKLNENTRCVGCPNFIEEFSGKTILTMDAVNGIKVTDVDNLIEQGYSRDDISKKLALAFCKQVFDDGFFHADPHPGNILIEDGKITFIDFGIVGELSEGLRKWLNKAIVSIAIKDIDGVINFIMAVGVVQGKVNINVLREDLDLLFMKYLSTSLDNIKISKLLQEMFEIAVRNKIKLPTNLVILLKSMVILEGVIVKINPDIEILDVVIPFVKSKNKDIFFDKIDKDELAFKLYRFTKDTVLLPTKMSEFFNYITKGQVKLELKVNDINKYLYQIHRMVNRMVWGIIVAAMIIASSLILNTNVGPKYGNVSIIGITGYIIAAVFGFWLIISIIKSGFF